MKSKILFYYNVVLNFLFGRKFGIGLIFYKVIINGGKNFRDDRNYVR